MSGTRAQNDCQRRAEGISGTHRAHHLRGQGGRERGLLAILEDCGTMFPIGHGDHGSCTHPGITCSADNLYERFTLDSEEDNRP